MRRFVRFFLVAVTTFSVLSTASSLDCSLYVEEHQSGLLNWFGAVSFPVPIATDETGWLLVMNWDQNFTGLGAWGVWVQSDKVEKWTRVTPRENNFAIKLGQPLYYTFRILYSVGQPKPQLVGLNFQGIEMCM